MEKEFKKKAEKFETAFSNIRLILATLLNENKITKNTYDILFAWINTATINRLSYDDVLESILDSALSYKGELFYGPYKITVVDHNTERKQQSI